MNIFEIEQKILLENNNKNYKNIFALLKNLDESGKNKVKHILKQIYSDISKTMQELNLNGKINSVKKIYKDVYDFIPNKEKKIKNIILNEYEIACRSICLKSYPRISQVFVTNKCNLRCFMCHENNHVGNYEISDNKLSLLLEIMPYLQMLFLRGGEVFLSKASDVIINKAIENSVKIEILTNGLLLTEYLLDKILSNNINLMVSIDSPNKDNYESIRGFGNFDKLLYVLDLVKKIRLKQKNNKCKLTLSMVVMKKNYNEIEKMIEFAHQYGFDNVALNSIVGYFPDENIFTNYKYKEIVKILDSKKFYFNELAKKYGIQLFNRMDTFDNNDNSEETENIPFCLAPFRECFFSMNGFSSQIECQKEIEGENLNTFYSFWNSNFMLKYREKIIAGLQKQICSCKCLGNKNVSKEHRKIIF